MSAHARSAPRRGDLAGGLALGLLLGLPLLWLSGAEPRYTVYGLVGLAGVATVPMLLRHAGSLERLLFVATVLALQLDVALAFDYHFKPAGPYGILVSPVLLAALALAVVRVVTSAQQLGPPLVVDRSLLRLLALFALAGLLSYRNAPNGHLAAFGLFEIGTVGLIALVVADACARDDGARVVQTLLGWTLVLQSLLVIVGYATGTQISLAHGVQGEHYTWSETGRFSGTLGAPSVAGTVLVLCLLAAAARWFERDPAQHRGWLALQLGLGTFALLLTQTRTAWVALVLAGGGLVYGAMRREGAGARRVLGVAALAGLAVLVAWPFIAERVTADHDKALSTRWELVGIAFQMIRDHPLLGIGINTATHQIYEYAPANVGRWVFIVHNQFLLVWTETGLLGIASFVGLFWLAFRRAARLAKAEEPRLRSQGRWLFWSLVLFVIALNLDHVSGAATYKFLFLVLGVAVGAARRVPPPAVADPRWPHAA